MNESIKFNDTNERKNETFNLILTLKLMKLTNAYHELNI